MNLNSLTIGFLRLLIGLGFTASLVFGVTLTMLTLFHGPGDSLVLNRPSFDWGWGGGAAAAWTLTVFWWLCWRSLPPVKPTQMFPTLERGLNSPAITVVGALICPLALAGAVCHQILNRHAHDWFAMCLSTYGTISSWSQLAQAWKHKHR